MRNVLESMGCMKLFWKARKGCALLGQSITRACMSGNMELSPLPISFQHTEIPMAQSPRNSFSADTWTENIAAKQVPVGTLQLHEGA